MAPDQDDEAWWGIRLAQQGRSSLPVMRLKQFTTLLYPPRRLVASFKVSWTEIPVIKYFGKLEGGGALVASFTGKNGLSVGLLTARFWCVLELETACSVGATLYAYTDRTGRYIM